ncbi:unnamed protein product [Cuscuta epithymum]|uniref:DUF659 domain-containing protein n=1 Tax=Cuscuta epithymum TaxID=186058 RepID=A0AAV0FG45_9ASTE|nr:unnamed protein product [Cuscuta epithymum]
MHKCVLAFREFNDRHTADNIYILIERILIEYNLLDKVFAVGFDNASNNTAAIPRLRELGGASTLMEDKSEDDGEDMSDEEGAEHEI